MDRVRLRGYGVRRMQHIVNTSSHRGSVRAVAPKKSKPATKKGGARPGSGRKPAIGTMTVYARMPIAVADQLDRLAAKYDKTRSDVLREIAEDAIKGGWMPQSYRRVLDEHR